MLEKIESKIFLIYFNNEEINAKKIITKNFNKNHRYIFLTKNKNLKEKYANIQEYTIEDDIYLNTDILKSIAFEVATVNLYKKIIIISFLKFLRVVKKKKILYINEFLVEELYTHNKNNCKKYFLNLKEGTVNKKIRLNNINNIIFTIIDDILNLIFKNRLLITRNIHYFFFNLKIFEENKNTFHLNKIKNLIFSNISNFFMYKFFYRQYLKVSDKKVKKKNYYSNLLFIKK